MKTNTQKGSIIPAVIVIVIVVLVIIGGIYIVSNIANKGPSEVITPQPLVGNDRDIHDCIGSAGYSWNETKQACVRPWEKNQATSSSSNPIACTMEAKACPDGSFVSRSGPKCEFKTCPSNVIPSIIVISPNGGESIKIGEKVNVHWNYPNPSSSTMSIFIQDDSINCRQGTVGCWNSFGIISDLLNSGTYLWDTNKKMFGPGGPDSAPVVSGLKYKIKVCDQKTNICDYSDNYFTITN